jgi:hypothetical protein
MNIVSVDFATFSRTLKAGCCVRVYIYIGFKRRRPFCSPDNLTQLNLYVSLFQMKTGELYVSVLK